MKPFNIYMYMYVNCRILAPDLYPFLIVGLKGRSNDSLYTLYLKAVVKRVTNSAAIRYYILERVNISKKWTLI